MSANVQDEERLLRRVAKGDLAAFDELYGRTAPAVAVTVRALRALPDQEQIRRVTALRDAANACRTSDLRSILTEPLPTSGRYGGRTAQSQLGWKRFTGEPTP